MSNLLAVSDFVVKRRPKLFEVLAGYDIYDQRDGVALGSVEQVGRSNLEKLRRPKREDNAKTFLELNDASGPVLVMTHVQAARSSLVVARPDGTDIGSFKLQNYFGKSRLAFASGLLAARTWRNKNFAMSDAGGVEIARFDMTQGSSGDHSHDNQYAVHINPAVEGDLRRLALAAAFAVDQIVWDR